MPDTQQRLFDLAPLDEADLELLEELRRQRAREDRTARRERAKRRRVWQDRQGMLFTDAQLELRVVVRLPVLNLRASACAGCPEREWGRSTLGPRRRPVRQRAFKLGRRDVLQRAEAQTCTMPCELVADQLNPEMPCTGCPHNGHGCTGSCPTLEDILPKSDPLIFDEISTEPEKLTLRNKAIVKPIDPSQWFWADVADDVRGDLMHAIDRALSPRQQTAMMMHLEGVSGVKIARAMGCTKVTVHWFLKRARRKIFEYMTVENAAAARRANKALTRIYESMEDD